MTVGQLTSLNGFVPFGISLGDNNVHAECYQFNSGELRQL